MTDIVKRNNDNPEFPGFDDPDDTNTEANSRDSSKALQDALARLSAAATEIEYIVEELAEIFADLATKDYCPAMRFDGEWILEVDTIDMVEEALAAHAFPTDELYDAVLEATLTNVDDMGHVWMRTADYDALCGADDPENLAPPEHEPSSDTNPFP